MQWQSNGTAGAGLIRALREVDEGVALIARGLCGGTRATAVVTTAVSLSEAWAREKGQPEGWPSFPMADLKLRRDG